MGHLDIKQFAVEQPHDLFIKELHAVEDSSLKLTETFVFKLQTSLVRVFRGSPGVVVPQGYSSFKLIETFVFKLQNYLVAISRGSPRVVVSQGFFVKRQFRLTITY